MKYGIKRSTGHIKPLNLWDALAILCMAISMWALIWGATWALSEVIHSLGR
jgi:hypothetical protein